MESPQRKRKAVALMEVVSSVSLQKFFATKGRCHRVSPTAKSRRELRPHQVGIAKSLTLQPVDATTDLQALIKAAVNDAVEAAVQRERKKELIFEDDVKRNLVTDITLRSLISEWSKTSFGKESLQRMTEAVNEKYDEAAKAKEFPYAHKVLRHDLLSELKQLVRRADTDDAAKRLLDSATVAIETSSHLPGQEFVELITGYVQANEQAHVTWTLEKLEHVLDLAKEDRLQVFGHTPALWIREMVHTIARVKGWVLEGV